MKRLMCIFLAIVICAIGGVPIFADYSVNVPGSNNVFEFIGDSDERINSNGTFIFQGDQIVSDYFKLKTSATETTITVNATAKTGSKFTIQLFEVINGGGVSVEKYTFVADGKDHSHTFKGIHKGATLYMVIKTSLLTSYVDGSGSISNFDRVV